jgi:putative peptide zinc metalloprotease protein
MAGLVAMDLWLFLSHGLAQGLRESMEKPTLFLLAFGLVVVSAAFHECGHATACTVGGGKPGRMGAGIYLAWPAFYTDVTDAYRLDRKARLRTDLGGVYFSCLLVLALGGVYAATRFEPLLLIAFLMQIEVVHQMLPFLRLDGYYVVSDLVGVPDLFRRTGPVLKSMVPGLRSEPSVLELKRWVRNVVRLWVLVVVPVLLFNIGMILLNFPRMLSTAWNSGARLVHGITTGGGTTVAIDVVQLVFLVIPIVGLGYTFAKLFGQIGCRGWTSTAGSPGKRAAFLLVSAAAIGCLVVTWWPDARYTPYRPGESGTLQSQAAALRYVGQGRPVLRSPSEVDAPLPPLPGALATGVSRPNQPAQTARSTETVQASPTPGTESSGTTASIAPESPSSAAPAPADSPAAAETPSPVDSSAPVDSSPAPATSPSP